MGLFNREKDINLQIAETTQKLNRLESKFTVLIRKERNAVGNLKTKAAKMAAAERLRTAYTSLRLVHIAQERLYAASSANELNCAVDDLNKSLGILNKIDKKSEGAVPLFLNFRARRLLNRNAATEEGGMKQYYNSSLEEVLVGEKIMEKLVSTNIPLQVLLKEDEETQENLDEFMEFVQAPDNEIGDIDLYDDLDALINNLD